MAFAFFYLVIGDLIIIHEKAFADYYHCNNNPYSKPHKAENVYKVKDKKSKVRLHLLTFVSEVSEIHYHSLFPSCVDVLCPLVSVSLEDNSSNSILLRGPPVMFGNLCG